MILASREVRNQRTRRRHVAGSPVQRILKHISLVVKASSLVTVSEVTILRNCEHAPEYLFAYLSSSTGQAQIEREITGATGQQHLLKSKVGNILVPDLPDGIE